MSFCCLKSDDCIHLPQQLSFLFVMCLICTQKMDFYCLLLTVVGFYHFSNLPPFPPSSCLWHEIDQTQNATLKDVSNMYIKVSWVLLHKQLYLGYNKTLYHAVVLKIIINLYSFKIRLQGMDVSLCKMLAALTPLLRCLFLVASDLISGARGWKVTSGIEEREQGCAIWEMRKGVCLPLGEHSSLHLGKDRAHGLKNRAEGNRGKNRSKSNQVK